MKFGKAIFIGLMILIGLAVFILGARNAPSAAPQGDIVLQYWEKWTGEEATVMKGIVDDFNRTVGKEKHIYVQYVSLSSVDQKTMVAIAAGVPPDIAGLWDAQLNDFAALDALEPLDDLAKEHGIGPWTYKPIYWKACTAYKHHLWGLISTPASVALHYNKQIFLDHADQLRAAGLDPNRAPETIDELDRYAAILTTYEPGGVGADRRIKTSGFLPMEPGWYVNVLSVWFGGQVFDAKTQKLQLTSTPMERTFDWLASYPKKFGKDSITEFRSGASNFASSQNPFFTGDVAMVQQGPWMANYIENFAPQMNRWHVPAEKQQREKDFDRLKTGMAKADVTALLGPGTVVAGDPHMFTYDAGIKTIQLTFDDKDQLSQATMYYIPAVDRKQYTQWGAVPFPSIIPGQKDVTYCSFDALVIPRGSKHKEEAFDFIAYVNRQDVMEKLCALHCKNSPLAKVSEHFIKYHPNPYIDVFDRLANSPNAHAVPSIPIWPEISDEINVATQKCYLLEQSPHDILKEADKRAEKKWNYFKMIQDARDAQAKEAIQ